MAERRQTGVAQTIEKQLPPQPSKALIPKRPLVMRLGLWLQPRINRLSARSSKIGNEAFYDTAHFPWVAQLEAQWEAIREEALRVSQDLSKVPPLAEISPDHRRIAPAGMWRSFFLYGYGYRVEANCEAAPVTARLLKSVPGLNSALFSILKPGTHIPAHTGVSKAILTCHLGLRVPAERARCRMRVGEEQTLWEEGKAFVFDDMFNHEVWNDTDEVRIVLLVQFRRPMRPLGRAIGELFLWGVRHSRFVQDARRGVAEWKAG
ncbi:aspartyl/asparaginyl beta-hydroxylase domain-containing protein [Sphingomonas morindae]|uniref:Aspartyl/asparaginyl beta-hydroxylase domain-containing protein n=1 Tax=Sphingomonas morindae TaxID=1541170 RepID=A0ABY4X6W8_9SPHN|nr:aspartyl/asparaginyl beta-hydroxylase domain-containing protein [Sphingomonas morindae]USI72350.1 aspartyl/asparaginyl beta-hydroxylase domain-containing protein [Sphingomonas morindae]